MQIGLLLQKYAHLGHSQKRIKEVVYNIFIQNSFDITSKDIDVRDTEVIIKISGARRAHFVLLRNKIEESIKQELKKEGIIVSSIF